MSRRLIGWKERYVRHCQAAYRVDQDRPLGRPGAREPRPDAPIWLYRARLGFVLGSRTLMLEHVGRKSGAKRYVVLEVVGHPAPDTYVVASGFGEHAQWFAT